MERFAWLGDGISDAAKRLLKKSPSLLSSASPGTTSLGARRWAQRGTRGSPAGQRAPARTQGPNTWPGDPLAGLPGAGAHPDPSPPRSLCSTFLSTARQTHTRSTPRPGCRHARRDGTRTHIRAHACACTSSSPSLLPRGCSGHTGASLLHPSIHHRPSPLPGSSAEAGNVLAPRRQLCCRTARVPARSPATLPAPRQRNRRNPKGTAAEDREPPPRQNSPVLRGRCRRGPTAGLEAVKL